jgi:putative transposase
MERREGKGAGMPSAIRACGPWRYLYREVDTHSHAIDVRLTPDRDQQATKYFLIKAIHRHRVLENITIDASGGTAPVIERYNTARVGGN